MKNYYYQKKIIVTGAGGFIGSHICEELVNKGAVVTAVVRKKSRTTKLKNIENVISLKEVDLTNKKQVRALIADHAIIIHAAAIDGGTAFKRKYADKIFHENVHMTMNVFESLKKGSFEKLVYISTAEVYANLKIKNHVREEQFSLTPPSRPEQWYAFSKMIGELTAQLTGNALGLGVIIVRPANIYGPKDMVIKKRLVPTILDAIKKKKKKLVLSGTGNDTRSFLHVEDYVQNLLQVIEKSQGGTYNIAGSKAVRIKDFAKIFSNVSGIPITFRDKSNVSKKTGSRFFLDCSQAKQLIPQWFDSPYEKRIQELIDTL